MYLEYKIGLDNTFPEFFFIYKNRIDKTTKKNLDTNEDRTCKVT